MAQGKRQPSRDWKTVAALVATETDSEKVLELVRELIRALDENSSLTVGQLVPESKKRAA